MQPIRIIHATAPMRICDNGGWTDTWFADHGRIFNIAVQPGAEVQLRCFPRTSRAERVIIHAENLGERYVWEGLGTGRYDRHPLLEATIEHIGIPDDLAIEVSIYSEAPHGASTGTSAAVTVAMAAALDALLPRQRTPHELAYAAHAVETERLGQQSGIQDQLAAAYGGINDIEMHNYPHSTVRQLQLSPAIEAELQRRLSLIYLGKPHNSSAVHETVIRSLEEAGAQGELIGALRQTAAPSRDALEAGDFARFGDLMKQNTEAQRALHPALVSPAAQLIIDLARSMGASGWKVNGAGGDGGSITLLGGSDSVANRAMVREILARDNRWQAIPIRLSPKGVTVWESDPT